MTSTTSTATEPHLEHVRPGELLLLRNIRDIDSKPDPELVESIKELGVIEPITAFRSDDGLVVHHGHRRAIAAVAAGVAYVPVYVAGDDTPEDREFEIERIIGQRDENTRRRGLTSKDELAVVEQLAFFGLTADQIVTRARIDRATVDAATTVLDSGLARRATARYEGLTLDQAQVVAEFEDDPETAKALIVTAIERPDQFAHTAQRQRDDRNERRVVEATKADLEAAGTRVLDKSPGYGYDLEYLNDKKTGKPVDVEKHAKCPGHAAVITVTTVHVDADGNEVDESELDRRFEEQLEAKIAEAGGRDALTEEQLDALEQSVDVWEGVHDEPRGVPTWYCTDPDTHGHRYRWASNSTSTAKKSADDMTDAEREKARKARQLVIDNNKAWDSAETVRREWLKVFAKRKTAPKGAAAFIAEALSTDRGLLTDYRSSNMIGQVLGGGTNGVSQVAKRLKGASEPHALLLALVQVLACYEATLTRESWRGDGKSNATGRYLRFLESCDYGLSDVEKFAISSKRA